MKQGPFVFLGLLFAMSMSWLGMIVTPQFQLGSEQPTNVPPANVIYPIPLSGLAHQGREVYRANGCAACHTQVIMQEGTRLDIVLNKVGTNAPGVVNALMEIGDGLSRAQAESELNSLPRTVATAFNGTAAQATQKALTTAGAEAGIHIVALGPDIQRGWGTRQTVARDYLYNQPLLLGRTRLGPDLTNVGLRRPDRVWQLMHLYNPASVVPGSMMPRYPFLFEKHKAGAHRSPNALPIEGPDEIIPTVQAEALADYLMSLRAETPLFEAPGPQVTAPPGTSLATNAPAGTANAPSGTGPANPSAPK